MRLLSSFVLLAAAASAAELAIPPAGNRILEDYFQREVASIESEPLPIPQNAESWAGQRATYRKQLAEMLGLEPAPQRTPLNVVKTGELKVGDDVIVEKLHYQSRPGLYVTANFYRPVEVKGKLPAILYVCGHANKFGKDGTSLGNKTGYLHHGVWFARNGYVCLTIDTVQLGEIRGEHHGTYRYDKWWWFSRGYTPAGTEAWNGIRGIDYLVSRPEVDPERIGVTGRSGGGAYSWYIAALDERVKAAAPTAGITTMRNHVVDGVVSGHCDCMYMVNTYGWDYDKVAALVAPRALLVCNTDKDRIFPLDGVYSVYASARKLYKALGAEGKIGIQIAEGGHLDTQALNTGAFAWFERWLKGANIMDTFDMAAKKVIDPEELRVFSGIPADERNTKIDEEFVPMAKAPAIPESAGAWPKQRESWLHALQNKVFRGWPKEDGALKLRYVGQAEHDGVLMQAWDFTPQEPFTLRLWLAHRKGLSPEDLKLVVLNVLDEQGWNDFSRMTAGHFSSLFPLADSQKADGRLFDQEKKMFDTQPWAMAYVAPRGVGPTAWTGSKKEHTHWLRRFYLLGQTHEGMQVYDIRRAIGALRGTDYAKTPLWLQAQSGMAVNALYASLFEPGIARLDLHKPPATHMEGPAYLNVLKYLDVPQAAAIAASLGKVRIYTEDKAAWSYTSEVAAKLGWTKEFELRDPERIQ